MKVKIAFFTSLFLLVGIIASIVVMPQLTYTTRAQDKGGCTLPGFVAQVSQGPNQGLVLSGSLALSVNESGEVTGNLTTFSDDAMEVPIVGQVNGHAINLAFDLGAKTDSEEHAYIFGVGTAVLPVSDCSGAIGGPLVGPSSGDLGDWGDCDPGCRPGLKCCPKASVQGTFN